MRLLLNQCVFFSPPYLHSLLSGEYTIFWPGLSLIFDFFSVPCNLSLDTNITCPALALLACPFQG